jgi:hypothetical protein
MTVLVLPFFDEIDKPCNRFDNFFFKLSNLKVRTGVNLVTFFQVVKSTVLYGRVRIGNV